MYANSENVSAEEAASILGHGVTVEHIRRRILRGTLPAEKAADGAWQVPAAALAQLLDERDPCGSCGAPADLFIIIKYHHKERVEFILCEKCANQVEGVYSRRGGVLEVVSFPLLSEGWLYK
jgi:hypothetical protein